MWCSMYVVCVCVFVRERKLREGKKEQRSPATTVWITIIRREVVVRRRRGTPLLPRTRWDGVWFYVLETR